VIFDNVLVPWSACSFIATPRCATACIIGTGASPQIMHQFSVKNLAKAEFMMAHSVCDSGVHQERRSSSCARDAGRVDPVHEFVRSVSACEPRSTPKPTLKGLPPAADAARTVRMMFQRCFIRMCEIIQILGAGGLVAVPSYAELSEPDRRTSRPILQAANAIRVIASSCSGLAFDAAGPRQFSGASSFTSATYSGDPVRLAATL